MKTLEGLVQRYDVISFVFSKDHFNDSVENKLQIGRKAGRSVRKILSNSGES